MIVPYWMIYTITLIKVVFLTKNSHTRMVHVNVNIKNICTTQLDKMKPF